MPEAKPLENTRKGSQRKIVQTVQRVTRAAAIFICTIIVVTVSLQQDGWAVEGRGTRVEGPVNCNVVYKSYNQFNRRHYVNVANEDNPKEVCRIAKRRAENKTKPVYVNTSFTKTSLEEAVREEKGMLCYPYVGYEHVVEVDVKPAYESRANTGVIDQFDGCIVRLYSEAKFVLEYDGSETEHPSANGVEDITVTYQPRSIKPPVSYLGSMDPKVWEYDKNCELKAS
ncbi:MAG: hypothetical protein AAGA60_00885 [Cyanobacteria bacterium P01_E01_bin.42]